MWVCAQVYYYYSSMICIGWMMMNIFLMSSHQIIQGLLRNIFQHIIAMYDVITAGDQIPPTFPIAWTLYGDLGKSNPLICMTPKRVSFSYIDRNLLYSKNLFQWLDHYINGDMITETKFTLAASWNMVWSVLGGTVLLVGQCCWLH